MIRKNGGEGFRLSVLPPLPKPGEGPVRDLPEEPGETLESGGPRQGLGPDPRLQRSENRSPTGARTLLTQPLQEGESIFPRPEWALHKVKA